MVDRTYGGRVVPKSEAGTQASQAIERREAAERHGGGGGGGGGGCFPAGTLISVGVDTQDIASLQTGDLVNAFDTRTGLLHPRRVLKVSRHSRRNIWRIAFDDGHQLRTTSAHSFRVANGWKVASRVQPGDEVLTCGISGTVRTRVVVESRRTGELEDVFNLIVENDFTFIADETIVHSFTHCRRLRMLLWSAIARGAEASSSYVGSTAC